MATSPERGLEREIGGPQFWPPRVEVESAVEETPGLKIEQAAPAKEFLLGDFRLVPVSDAAVWEHTANELAGLLEDDSLRDVSTSDVASRARRITSIFTAGRRNPEYAAAAERLDQEDAEGCEVIPVTTVGAGDRTVTFDLHCWDGGSDEVVLGIHALAASQRSLRLMRQELQADGNVGFASYNRYDRLSLAKSASLSAAEVMDQESAKLLAATNELLDRGKTVVWSGHSMGTQIAKRAAAKVYKDPSLLGLIDVQEFTKVVRGISAMTPLESADVVRHAAFLHSLNRLSPVITKILDGTAPALDAADWLESYFRNHVPWAAKTLQPFSLQGAARFVMSSDLLINQLGATGHVDRDTWQACLDDAGHNDFHQVRRHLSSLTHGSDNRETHPWQFSDEDLPPVVGMIGLEDRVVRRASGLAYMDEVREVHGEGRTHTLIVAKADHWMPMDKRYSRLCATVCRELFRGNDFLKELNKDSVRAHAYMA